MAIPLVQVRHKVTGKKTFLPASALPNFPDYVKTPSQKARDEVPDGSAFPAEAAAEAATETSADAPSDGDTTATTTSASTTKKKENS